MTTATAVEGRLTRLWETPKTVYGWFATVDHKELGIRYLVTAFIFLIIGGLEALLMRLQLAHSEGASVSGGIQPDLHHARRHHDLLVCVADSLRICGLSCSADDRRARHGISAPERLHLLDLSVFGHLSLSRAVYRPGAARRLVRLCSLHLTLYSPGLGMDIYALALILLTISTTGGAINFIVTILRLRAPGMAISRMPLFLYSTLTISFVILFALPALTAACIFLELDRRWGTHFFAIAGGGDTFLWQQLFWFFGHPWVYVIFLPATGMISLIIPVFSRRPIVGYPYVAIATILTGVVGFGVWLHHMFTVGMSDMAMSFFSAGSMTISVFTTIQVFAWVATVWKGRAGAHDVDALCPRFGGAAGHRWTQRRLHRHHSRRLAGAQHLLRGRRTSTTCSSARTSFPSSPASTTGCRR